MAQAGQPSPESYTAAAWLLRCDVRAVKSVAQVEAGHLGAFLTTGEPVILFEPHLFDRFTNGAHRGAKAAGVDPAVADLSYPRWRAGKYGPTSVQHKKLAAAVALNRSAALRATSWGLFQILGDNHVACGYPDLQRFVTAMYRSVDDHLRAFVQFIRYDKRLVDAIRVLDWRTFSRIYNGPAFETNRYDARLAEAYKKATK